MADYKLIGHNYQTPDLVAKVTGRAKYAEDYRAEGMLFCKLLLSPRPHARIRRIDASAALAMPGVHAILTADDMPPPPPPPARPAAAAAPPAGRAAQGASGTAPTATPQPPAPQPAGPPPAPELALTKEPMYEGEPILALAADSEEIAAEALDRIIVDYEPLPFVIDPLDGLRPDGPDGRTDGNVFAGNQVKRLKWTAAQIAEADAGRFPMDAEATDTAVVGDVEAGFKEADLIIEDVSAQQTTPHQPLESRTAMAYWQNGKLYLHGSTQSVARTVASVANWCGIKPEELVLISEYTGGGFGSKIPGAQSMAIPALLSKKVNGRPVMMRISREEETYIGRVRPGFQAGVKMGFKKDGRIVAIDAFIVEASGPYRRQGDNQNAVNLTTLTYQAPNVRFRGISVATNTPPGVSQRAPGGLQSSVMFEPIVSRAARQLGIDQVQIRLLNAPAGPAPFGLAPPDAPPGRARSKVTSCFVKEALEKGAALFNWEERKQRSGQRRGSKVTGVAAVTSTFTAGSIGVDGLFTIRPDGTMYIQQGIGNLGTHSVIDTARVIAEILDFPWEKVVVTWGNTGNHLPWSSIQAGSQTTYAHTRANYAAAMDGKRKLQEIAAKDLGGSPDDYDVGGERVFRKGGGRGLTFAQAAERAIALGGIYDGHELPKEINAMTRASATAQAGLGLMGVARDNLPRDGQTYGFMASFAEVEVDVETGHYRIVDYVGVSDVGTVMHPNSLGGQMLGGSIQGFGHVMSQRLVYDKHYGAALAKRLHHNKPPTILDAPLTMQWDAVGLPDPTNPIGAKGIGEPAIGAGGAALICAVGDAIGYDIVRRTPVQPEHIVTGLAKGSPAHERLTAFI
jgi:CO/xanthine dehydrogenase Mo-binding subunit